MPEEKTITFHVSDNAKAVLIAIVGAVILALQIVNAWQTAKTDDKVNDAAAETRSNGANIQKVRKDVRDVQNHQRKVIGMAPVPPIEEDRE